MLLPGNWLFGCVRIVRLSWRFAPAVNVAVGPAPEPSSALNVAPVSGWRPVTGSAASATVTVSGEAPAGSGLSAWSVSTRVMLSCSGS